MKNRIFEILNYTGMTATRLADEIGVQRSGISHMISGRNQPSFDFFVKLLTRFPEIDANWLLTGKGEMIKTDKRTVVTEPKKSEDISSKVTNVTSIVKIILLNSNGTFEEYRHSGKE